MKKQKNILSILKKSKDKIEKITLPDGDVYVRCITAKERQVVAELISEEDKDKNEAGYIFMRALITICLCDETGVRVLSDDDDVFEMCSASVVDKIFLAAMKLNGLDDEKKN